MTAAFDRLARHDVTLWLDGRGWAGWTSVSIERGIDTVAGGFDISFTSRVRTGDLAWAVSAGMPCQVTLGSETLITGHVDAVSRSFDSQNVSINLRGRDKAADLVDCSAINSPGMWRGQKLEAIAREIASPFGVEIEVHADTGRPFARFALQQGETAWTAIERMARYRGVIAWSTGDGTIRIGNTDSGEVAGQIIAGVNVLAAESDQDHSARFSDYVVKGQASGDDNRHGRATAQVKAETRDASITRYRPLLVVAEEQSDTASLRKRAAWEAQTRAARSLQRRVTVPGWYAGNDASGPVWQPGARAYVRIPWCAVDATLLIERVRLVRDGEAGTFTELTLVPPEAWAQLAEPEPKR